MWLWFSNKPLAFSFAASTYSNTRCRWNVDSLLGMISNYTDTTNTQNVGYFNKLWISVAFKKLKNTVAVEVKANLLHLHSPKNVCKLICDGSKLLATFLCWPHLNQWCHKTFPIACRGQNTCCDITDRGVARCNLTVCGNMRHYASALNTNIHLTVIISWCHKTALNNNM